MKIALIGTAYPYRGGLASYNERLAREFQVQGHEVTIYTFTLQYPDYFFPGQTQYSEEPPPEDLKIVRCINSVNPLNWVSVGRQIKASAPDLVLIKFWLPFMGPCFGTILRTLKRGTNIPVVSIIDNIVPHEQRPGDRVFAKYFVGPVDGFVAMSRSVEQELDEFRGTKPVVFSPHPIFDNFGEAVPRAEAMQKLGLDPTYKYLLFFGLIRDYKGLDLLLEAFAETDFRGRKIKLIIAGEYYADRKPYDELIAKHDLADDIHQVDRFIQDSEVATYFGACDLLVQPYKTATQSGVTQIAYHFNTPMVVTDVGGLAEMCPHEVVGYVVPPKPEAVADAIRSYFEQDLQEVMTANVAEEKKKYSWAILVRRIQELKDRIQSGR
ncbi:glycosyl transferase family 1 [Lewinellaceae bacterium SD302]|nr:glycosyl transferase family 1 [Lewinellaceae bacterium SD302]